MIGVLALAVIALGVAKLDPRLAFGIFTIAAVIYSDREDLKLGIRCVNDNTSIFNVYLLAAALSALSSLGIISSEVVYTSVFILLAHEFRKSVMWNVFLFTLLAFAYLGYFNYINGIKLDPAYLFFLSLSGGLSAALVESVESNADKRVTLLIASATVFTIFKIYVPSASLESLALAFAVSFVLSLIALKAGVADESGLMSATLVGTTLILFTDFRFFVIIMTFYMLGSIATKYKYEIKQNLGIAEQAGGARGYANVFGNSLAPLFFAIHYGVTKEEIFAIAFVASVATALGDTLASEIGKTARNVYLITNFKKVRAGKSGGVSIIGEFAALIGAVIVAAIALILGIVNSEQAIIACLAAFIAVHVDSYLGATIEEKGYITNSCVNFLATLIAGVFCYFFLKI